VVGQTQAAATTAITGAGLVVGTVTTASSNTVAAGSVISESPIAGTMVAPGSKVNLVVSTGPAPVAVPNVVGQTQAAATTAITGAGLVVGTVTTASSNTVAAGSVISESPVAGTLVAPGSSVNLVVSTGPGKVAVPNVVGLTQAAATTAITNAGLVLGTVTTASSSTVPAGSVISESPIAGTMVAPGSSVNLVVSTGPAKVAVPNVVGLTQAAATTAITNAGLVLGTVTTASSSTVPAGSVISESPIAGTQVSVGSAVNLVTSTGVPPTVVSFNVLFGKQKYNVTTSARHRLPWQVTGIQVVFSQPITTGSAASLGGATVTGFSGLGTSTLSWSIVPVAQANLAITLAGSGAAALMDAAGNGLSGGSGFAQALKILWGDFNDDGVVSAADLVGINNATIAPYNVLADMNGDLVVNITDVQLARLRVGTSLP
jgi:beta-lactam-binding protein with PASTA domain